jgi:hypothetical protein
MAITWPGFSRATSGPQYGEDFPIPNAFNFTWAEVADPDSGLVRITPRFWKHMELLQALRVWWDAPLTVTSAHRRPPRNAHVGGGGNSQHLLFTESMKDDRFATDVVPSRSSPRVLYGMPSRGVVDLMGVKAEELGFTGIGRYENFLHLDLRERKTKWGQ